MFFIATHDAIKVQGDTVLSVSARRLEDLRSVPWARPFAYHEPEKNVRLEDITEGNMAEFQNPFFTSTSADVEAEYVAGVNALQAGDCNASSRHFGNAAQAGHVSALFNLSLLWGGGQVTPYDFDLAADCWYKAAEAGHPRAKAALWQLEAADRGGFGADNLAKFAAEADAGNSLVPSIMICAARFYDVVCRKYGATVDVIAYELDAAATSDLHFVQAFIERTGIDTKFYDGGLNRLKPGSAADQITDGLNKLYIAMRHSGVSDELAVMARCSIVGYVITKSPYGTRSRPLCGVDTFFENEIYQETDVFEIFGGEPEEEPPNSIGEAKTLIERLGPTRGDEIIRAAAMSGNVFCQIFMSEMASCILADGENERVKLDLEIFTKMAANSGDAASQFNLGKLYMSKIDKNAQHLSPDDIENIRQAKCWYSMAAKQGLREAKASLNNLEALDLRQQRPR